MTGNKQSEGLLSDSSGTKQGQAKGDFSECNLMFSTTRKTRYWPAEELP